MQNESIMWCSSRTSSLLGALFPWLPWTFPQGAPCHGNANRTVFFWKQTVRGSVASEQNNVLICFVGQMWRLYDKTFTSSRKLAREMDFPVECRWRYSFLACACNIAMSSPRADTCGFNPIVRTNTFTPSLHPCISWSIPLVFAPISEKTQVLLCLSTTSFSPCFAIPLSISSSSLLSLVIPVLVILSGEKSLKYFPAQVLEWRMYDSPLAPRCFESVVPKHLCFLQRWEILSVCQ